MSISYYLVIREWSCDTHLIWCFK